MHTSPDVRPGPGQHANPVIADQSVWPGLLSSHTPHLHLIYTYLDAGWMSELCPDGADTGHSSTSSLAGPPAGRTRRQPLPCLAAARGETAGLGFPEYETPTRIRDPNAVSPVGAWLQLARPLSIPFLPAYA
jgi:hypothetical protein